MLRPSDRPLDRPSDREEGFDHSPLIPSFGMAGADVIGPSVFS